MKECGNFDRNTLNNVQMSWYFINNIKLLLTHVRTSSYSLSHFFSFFYSVYHNQNHRKVSEDTAFQGRIFVILLLLSVHLGLLNL